MIELKKGQIYTIVDRRAGTITVGKKGGAEYTVKEMDLLIQNVKINISGEELYRYAKKESEYIEFEQVKSHE